MILSGSLASEARLSSPMSFIYFPVMVHAFDILVSSVGILAVGDGTRGSGFGGDVSNEMDPLRIMKRGYRVALALAAVVFFGLTRWLLFDASAPYAWLSYFACGVIGMITSYIFILSTQVRCGWVVWHTGARSPRPPPPAVPHGLRVRARAAHCRSLDDGPRHQHHRGRGRRHAVDDRARPRRVLRCHLDVLARTHVGPRPGPQRRPLWHGRRDDGHALLRRLRARDEQLRAHRRQRWRHR